MRRSSSRGLMGIIGLALMAASCSSGGSTATPDTATPDTATPDTATPDTAAQEPGAVPDALRFTAPAVGGGQIDAASFAGKPTVFWFWAPT